MRKFLTGMVVMLFIIALAAAGGFGYLYFNGQAALNTAKQDKLNSDVQLAGVQQTIADLSKPRTFTDDKLGLSVTYPFDWKLVLSTDITTKFAQDGDVAGPILGGYGLTFTKGEAVLTVNKILGGIGGRESYIDPAKFDFKILTSSKGDIVRFSEKGKNEWFYDPKVSCADIDEAAGKADAICGGLVFGKIDNNQFPATAKLKTSDGALITEADGIMLSLQK